MERIAGVQRVAQPSLHGRDAPFEDAVRGEDRHRIGRRWRVGQRIRCRQRRLTASEELHLRILPAERVALPGIGVIC